MPPLRHEQTSNIDWFNAHFRLQTRIPSIPKKKLLNKTSWTRNHSIASRKESQRQRVLQYRSREGNENQTQTHTFLPVLGQLLISHWWLHLWVLPRALYMYFFPSNSPAFPLSESPRNLGGSWVDRQWWRMHNWVAKRLTGWYWAGYVTQIEHVHSSLAGWPVD